MSFGFSVGDFIAVGQLALDIYSRCRQCTGQYHDLSRDVGQLALVLSNFESLSTKNRLSNVQKRQLMKHNQACEKVLIDIGKTLAKYESLSSKSRKIHHMLGWNNEDARDLRDRLTATVVMVSTFYDELTMSSLFRLESAMTCLLQQTLDSPEAWRALIRDLEDLGVSAKDANKHREFIVQCFAHALEADDDADVDSLGKGEYRVTEIAVQPDEQRDLRSKNNALRGTGGWWRRKLNLLRQSKEQNVQQLLMDPFEDASSVEDIPLSPVLAPQPTFKVPLQALYERDGLPCPIIVRTCVDLVHSFRLDVDGIYSTAAPADYVLTLQQTIDEDHKNSKGHIEAACTQDPRLVAALLKHFLNNLPRPLVDDPARLQNGNYLRSDIALYLSRSLPTPQYATLRTVILHLASVAQHSARNRETPLRLAWTFAPILFADNLGNPYAQAQLLEHIINDAQKIFPWDDERAENIREKEL